MKPYYISFTTFVLGSGLMLALFLTACSSQVVIVLDTMGAPIENAEIYAVAPSMETGPEQTNAKGEAGIPSNAQGTKWITIRKSGYHDIIQEPIPSTWPHTVTLKKL